MNTVVPRERKDAFAVWVTGLPASGKSTLAASLRTQLAQRGVKVAVLESDVFRRILTQQPRYGEDERERFYRQIVDIGSLLTRQGVPIIFDATANRRRFRDAARQEIPRFLEVFVDCPLETCMARDPKGIYQTAGNAAAATVPGLQSPYEAPEHPDVIVPCGQPPDVAVDRVITKLLEKQFL